MKNSTKDVLYTILDLLDSLSRSSQSALFMINKEELKTVKSEIFELINPRNDSINSKTHNKKSLIGTLPFVMMDKTKFPSNESIIRLARKSLDFGLPNWEKKSREEIIGRIITDIASKSESQIKIFYNAWNKFISSEEEQEKGEKQDFVRTWLEFFNKYKHGNYNG